MGDFFILEGGNISISLFFIAIALFVYSRKFIDLKIRKFILIFTIVLFSLLIAGHYKITTDRMVVVKKDFLSGKKIVCENRENRKSAQSVIVRKDLGWRLDGDTFINANYTRPFHTSRCVPSL